MRQHSKLTLAGGTAVIVAMVSGGGAAADCTCRAAGRNHELGASVCMPTSSGSRLATCGMVLNNTSWQISSTPCVDAGMRDDDRKWGGAPAHATHAPSPHG